MKIVFLLLSLFSTCFCAKLPGDLKLCHKSSPDFLDCIKEGVNGAFKRFKNGYKPLGLPAIDPLKITEMSSESGGFKQTYKNVEVTGISISTVMDVQFVWDKMELHFKVMTPYSELTGDYALQGQLLTFPIDSAGKCKIEFTNTITYVDAKLERFEKNGKNHLRFISWKIKQVPEKIHYDYENLMPGNEQLSATILKTMNDNALELFQEIGSSFGVPYGEVHRSLANLVFEKVPEDDIFLP